MKQLERLKSGDAIGIFSPSSPVTYSSPKRFQRAKAFLEGKGFIIFEGKLTGKQVIIDPEVLKNELKS